MLSRSDKLKRKKVNKFLSFIVICVTLSVLILPAFTLENKDDDTNDNDGPTTVENINKQGGAEDSSDSALEPVINNNNDESSSEDDVLVVGEEVTTLTEDEGASLLASEETTTVEPYVLKPENIKSINLTYKQKGADGELKNITVNAGETINLPETKYLRMDVKYENISVKDLRNNYDKSFKYELPSFFRIAGTKTVPIHIGETEVGTITINENNIIVKYNDSYINNLSDTYKLEGSFYVEGEIKLSELNNGETTLFVPNGNISLEYGSDYFERYGDLTISKTSTKEDKNSDFIKYSITVTAGLDGCGNVYVVDNFTDNKNLVSYVEIPTVEERLKSEAEGQKPFETIENNTNADAGKIYKTNLDTTNKIPGTVTTVTEPGVFVWNIGNMATNETRTLTYYVKLNEGRTLSNNNKSNIKNDALAYARKNENIYDKGKATNTFTPSIDYDMEKNHKSPVKNSDGSYTIDYELSFELKIDQSNFPLKNFEFKDDLYYQGDNHKTDEKALEYIKFDRNSVKLYKSPSEEITNIEVSWSKDDDNYKTDWTDATDGNPKRFKVSVKDGGLTVNPGEKFYVKYSLTVYPEAFANAEKGKLEVKNRFLVVASNSKVKFNPDILDRIQHKVELDEYKWVEKTNVASTTGETIVNIPSSEKVYDATFNEVINSGNMQFTVPGASYKYVVNVNQTKGEWDVTNSTMTDTLSPVDYMEYVGYVKITARNEETNTDVETKWVDINGKSSFSLKPSDIGWTNNNYSYKFEYYAKTKGLDGVSSVTVTNTFKLDKAVRNGKTFNFNNVQGQQSITLEGFLTLSAYKKAWYYEEPKVTEGNWKNGAIYWITKLSGNTIKKGTVIKDAILSSNKDFKDLYIHNDSNVGVYRSKLDIADTYKDIEELQNSGLVDISNKFDIKQERTDSNYPADVYNDLFYTANEDIVFGEDNIYIVVKTEPRELPIEYRKPFDYKNYIYRMEGENKKELCAAEYRIYYNGDILKELGQTFTYDGTDVKCLDTAGSDQGNTSKIIKNFLEKTGPGVYASWAFKPNHSGDLSGDYQVLEDIPEGMELAYIRIKWNGEQASDVKSMKIAGINSSDWEKTSNSTIDDDGKQKTTIYYVRKDGRQALIKLGSFTNGHVHDAKSVDVQVVCKVTDPSVLLGGRTKVFTNNVTLLNEDGTEIISKANADATFTKEVNSLDKTHTSNGKKINYVITANGLGQKLPSNTEDDNYLMLVDEIGPNLKVDTNNITAEDAGGNNVDITTSYDPTTNTLRFRIPNSKKVIIKYAATVKAPPSTPVTISNTVYWDGYDKNGGKVDSQENFSYSSGGTVGGGERPTLTIYKKDQDTLNQLDGVKFELYKCDLVNNEIDNKTKINDAYTTVNGIINIENLYTNIIYMVKEIATLDGYILDSREHYIVGLYGNDYTELLNNCNSYNSSHDNKIEIAYNNDDFSLDIYNVQKGIVVKKAFKNAGGNEITYPLSGKYVFGLYEKNGSEETLVEKKSIVYSVSDTEVSKSIKFINLDLNKKYVVYELDDSGNKILNSNNSFINKTEYLTTYSNSKEDGTITNNNEAVIGDTVTVTNQVFTRQLPATGGNGINGYIKSGTILMLLTGVLLLKRRR